MNKSEIAQQIKETEEKLASLREELEKPNFPTLFYAKPGDMLENGCVVVEKFPSVMLALIAAPRETVVYCRRSNDFDLVFKELEKNGFNRSEWFIPTIRQLQMAFNNCKDNFGTDEYWSSTVDCNSSDNLALNFGGAGRGFRASRVYCFCTRAFSLVDY